MLTFIILDVINLIVPIDLSERNPIKEWLRDIISKSSLRGDSGRLPKR